MDFLTFILVFLFLAISFFVGYIVGFQNGRDQAVQDLNKTMDKSPAHNRRATGRLPHPSSPAAIYENESRN